MLLINERLNYTKERHLIDIFLFTGNSYINKKGELVMGRGAALEVKKHYPNIPKILGDKIKEIGKRHPVFRENYGLIILNSGIGVFQVKYHYKDSADLNLINYSAKILSEFAKLKEDKIFHMNFPGIGYGQLDEKDVLPIIEQLPNNVRIYKC